MVKILPWVPVALVGCIENELISRVSPEALQAELLELEGSDMNRSVILGVNPHVYQEPCLHAGTVFTRASNCEECSWELGVASIQFDRSELALLEYEGDGAPVYLAQTEFDAGADIPMFGAEVQVAAGSTIVTTVTPVRSCSLDHTDPTTAAAIQGWTTPPSSGGMSIGYADDVDVMKIRVGFEASGEIRGDVSIDATFDHVQEWLAAVHTVYPLVLPD